MKFEVNREELNGVLGLVSKIAAVRSPQPSIQGVKFAVSGDRMVAMATDLYLSIRVHLDLEMCSGEEEFLLLPERLSQVLREVDDEKVTFVTDEVNVMLECKTGTFRFRRLGTEDFPEFPAFKDGSDVKLKTGPFTDLLDRTVYCAGRDKGRYAINGVYVKAEDGKAELVATDGRRLAVCNSTFEGIPEVSGIILPLKLVQVLHTELHKMDRDSDLEFNTDGSRVVFRFGDVHLSGSLVEGEYPRYNAVIPKALDKNAKVDREECIRICRIASIFTDTTKRSSRFTFSSGKLEISSELQEQGESNLEMEIEYDGEKTRLGFNPVYVIEYLKSVDAEKVNIAFSSSERAVLITHDDDEYNYRFALMPMKVND
ncbi:MAG: DNA polymerase III subunit beta [Planctomycetota bacterium]|nr:DNA polymerase III subunit beta [Planctomycetota bacterium]